jgi:hypothetical protein
LFSDAIWFLGKPFDGDALLNAVHGVLISTKGTAQCAIVLCICIRAVL